MQSHAKSTYCESRGAWAAICFTIANCSLGLLADKKVLMQESSENPIMTCFQKHTAERLRSINLQYCINLERELWEAHASCLSWEACPMEPNSQLLVRSRYGPPLSTWKGRGRKTENRRGVNRPEPLENYQPPFAFSTISCHNFPCLFGHDTHYNHLPGRKAETNTWKTIHKSVTINEVEILLAQGAHTYGLSLRSSQRWRLKLPSIAGDVDRYGWRYTWSLRPQGGDDQFPHCFESILPKSTWGFPFWDEEESILPGTKAACMMYGILVDSSI